MIQDFIEEYPLDKIQSMDEKQQKKLQKPLNKLMQQVTRSELDVEQYKLQQNNIELMYCSNKYSFNDSPGTSFVNLLDLTKVLALSCETKHENFVRAALTDDASFIEQNSEIDPEKQLYFQYSKSTQLGVKLSANPFVFDLSLGNKKYLVLQNCFYDQVVNSMKILISDLVGNLEMQLMPFIIRIQSSGELESSFRPQSGVVVDHINNMTNSIIHQNNQKNTSKKNSQIEIEPIMKSTPKVNYNPFQKQNLQEKQKQVNIENDKSLVGDTTQIGVSKSILITQSQQDVFYDLDEAALKQKIIKQEQILNQQKQQMKLIDTKQEFNRMEIKINSNEAKFIEKFLNKKFNQNYNYGEQIYTQFTKQQIAELFAKAASQCEMEQAPEYSQQIFKNEDKIKELESVIKKLLIKLNADKLPEQEEIQTVNEGGLLQKLEKDLKKLGLK